MSTEELLRIERAGHQQYRQRGGNIINDNSHGVVTDADLIASAEDAFVAYDKEKSEHARNQAR